jgi:DNA-binding NarL/FixJ family response regulator
MTGMSDLVANPHARVSPDAHPAPGDPTRLVVVDADERTRQSIVGLLAIRDNLRVVGSAGLPGPALEVVTRLRPDVVIIDPRLPDVPAGAALIRAIRNIDGGIRILAVGPSPDPERALFEAGADAYLRKTFQLSVLTHAVACCVAPVPSTAPGLDHQAAEPRDGAATRNGVAGRPGGPSGTATIV